MQEDHGGRSIDRSAERRDTTGEPNAGGNTGPARDKENFADYLTTLVWGIVDAMLRSHVVTPETTIPSNWIAFYDPGSLPASTSPDRYPRPIIKDTHETARAEPRRLHRPSDPLLIDGNELEVTVKLHGTFQPIDGYYHRYGRVAAHRELSSPLNGRKKGTTIRTPLGEAPAHISDPDPWDRYRITGKSTPPFPVRIAEDDILP